ncbi:factor H binding protein domain-containing protein [Haemophilus parahaemolyticus]
MKLKNVTLAAALLAVLTGCGSNGSGNNNATPNSEVHNNQATQAQLAKQRAELEQLKLQLAQAQTTQKQAEEKLNSANQASQKEVDVAQQNLATAQQNVTNIQIQIENSNNAQAKLQEQLNQAQQEVYNAKTAKQHAEKILEEKQQAVSEAQTALKNAGDRVTAAKKTLETLQTNPQMATQADFNQKLTEAQKALNEANAAKQAVEKQLTDRNNEIINIQKNLTASNDKLAKATQGLNDAQDKIVKAEQEKQALQAKLDQATQAQSTAEKAYNATLKGRDEALNQIRADLEAKQKELATKEQALTDAKQQLATAQETAKQDEASKAILEEQLKAANTNLEMAKKTKANTEKAFQQQLASKDNELVKARENLTASNDKLAKAEQDLKAAQASIQAGNASKIALENQLNEAKQNLEAAKQAKDGAEQTLKAQIAEKEQLLNTAQKEKNDAYDKLQAALEAKQKAEKALADKNALEQPLDKARTLEFALNGGLNNQDAQDFSERYKDKSKSELQEILNGWHKHIRLLNLARDQAGNFGFYDNESREKFAKEFAKENKDKTVKEAYEVLNEKLKQHNAELEKERLEHEKQVNALVDIAKGQGLSDSDAANFANRHQNLSPDEFKSQLQAKMTELVNQAKAVGLDENIANQFAKENINNSGDSLDQNLKQLKVNLFTELANNSGLSQSNVYNLIHMNSNTLLSTDDFKKLIKASVFITKGTENNYLGDSEVAFIKKYLSLSDAEIEAKIQKRNELSDLLDGYYSDIINKDSNFSSEIGNFLNNNAEKSQEEQFAAIAKIFKKNYITNLDNHPENQISNIPLKTSKSSNVHYENSGKVYNQTYSVTLGKYSKETRDEYNPTSYERFTIENKGLQTKEEGLPTEGRATYTGKAFNLENNGDLTYNVNFSERKGSGSITGFQKYGTITLEEAPLQVKPRSKQVGIKNGRATPEKNATTSIHETYNLDFYGPKAEEIGGSVYFGDYSGSDTNVIGFSGTRGEIQK